MSRQLSVKEPYETLKKCKKPVLIRVETTKVGERSNSRIRLVVPHENSCVWMSDPIWDKYFDDSCFFYHDFYKTNIEKMQNYDEDCRLVIVEIIEL